MSSISDWVTRRLYALRATFNCQHYLAMVGATIAVPFLLAPILCIEVDGVADEVAKAELMGTIFFVSGVATLLQTTFGCRLPIVQGGSFAFLAPAFAILTTGDDQCPVLLPSSANITAYYETRPNETRTVIYSGSAEHSEIWKSRMRIIQGAITVAALFQVVVGFAGIIGFIRRFIGPLVIAPTIALIGMSLFAYAADKASEQWGISLFTIALLLIFAQYLREIKIPCYSSEKRSCLHSEGYPLFRLFPVILAVVIAYILSVILTYTDVFPNDPNHSYYRARTDNKISVVANAKWFIFPYPGQWGMPEVTLSGVLGMIAGVLASMIESVGDYYATARLSDAPPPTIAAINRGIGMEGIGCIIAGICGSGNGTTSYGENIGAIGITKVASRRVIQTGALVMIVLGVFNKFCAVFVTIPDPILGGLYFAMFGFVGAVGFSNLQFVDMNSSRNLFVLGVSFIFGLAIPNWMINNSEKIATGSDVVDDIFKVLLRTGMFVAGSIAFFLDNTLPGTAKERGLEAWNQVTDDTEAGYDTRLKCYDLPFGNEFIYRMKWTRYVPFFPNFLQKRGVVSSAQLTNVKVTDHKEDKTELSTLAG